MARSLSTLIAVMQHTLDAQPWVLDPNVVPIGWQESVFEEIQTRPLTVGILIDDGVVKIHPPIERALRDLEAKLKAAGHETVPWSCAGHKECIEIMVRHFYDVTRGIHTNLEPGSFLFRRWWRRYSP